MRACIVSVFLALAPTAFAQGADGPEKAIAFGVTGDIGVFIRGLTIGTGGLGVYGSTGIGGVGGRAFFATDQGIRLGAEGAVDWDMRGDIDAEFWWVGGLAGVMRPVDRGRFAGASLGLGYGEANESNFDYHQEYFYFRPRTSVLQMLGPLAAEIGLYFMLPIVLSQTLDGRDYDFGWTPWAGVDLTILFVKPMN